MKVDCYARCNSALSGFPRDDGTSIHIEDQNGNGISLTEKEGEQLEDLLAFQRRMREANRELKEEAGK